MSNTNTQTEASAVLVAGIMRNLDALIDLSIKKRIQFDRFYFGKRKLTNEERDYAIKKHFELNKELSTYSKILLDLRPLERIKKAFDLEGVKVL